jgi:hypothetical protein
MERSVSRLSFSDLRRGRGRAGAPTGATPQITVITVIVVTATGRRVPFATDRPLPSPRYLLPSSATPVVRLCPHRGSTPRHSVRADVGGAAKKTPPNGLHRTEGGGDERWWGDLGRCRRRGGDGARALACRGSALHFHADVARNLLPSRLDNALLVFDPRILGERLGKLCFRLGENPLLPAELLVGPVEPLF